MNRGRAIAHFIEHGKREAYSAEKNKEKMEREREKNGGDRPSYDHYRQGGGKA